MKIVWINACGFTAVRAATDCVGSFALGNYFWSLLAAVAFVGLIAGAISAARANAEWL